MDSDQKKKRKSITDSGAEANEKVPLDVGIKNWLQKQGYPLEMTVARTLEAARFHVMQSGTYVDPDSEKLREIDVTAQLHSENQPVLVQVGFAIECKFSDKPWLLFLSNSKPEHFAPTNLICSDLSLQLLSHRFTAGKVDNEAFKIQHLSWFSSAHMGNNITQVFTNGPDMTYEALMTSVKACLHRVEKINTTVKIPGSKPMCSIMFPAIVVDGQLFEAHLDSGENIVVNEIDSGIVVWGGAFQQNQVQAYVHIATRKSLNALVNDMRKIADTVIEFHITHMEWLTEAAKRNRTGYIGA